MDVWVHRRLVSPPAFTSLSLQLMASPRQQTAYIVADTARIHQVDDTTIHGVPYRWMLGPSPILAWQGWACSAAFNWMEPKTPM